MKHFDADIIILGAGITGLVASLRLEQSGYSVCVLEKNNTFKYKPGESLNPLAKNYLSQFNLNLPQKIATEYNGHAIQWGSSQTTFSEFIYNPYGNGLCVDRSKIEEYLSNINIVSGNLIFLDSIIQASAFNGRKWELRFSQGVHLYSLKGKLIIFATGRNIPKNFGIKPHQYFDKLISLSVVLENPPESTLRNLLIESMPNGWMYSNILPDNKRIISFFTDNDLLDNGHFYSFNKNYSTSQLIKSYLNNLNIDGDVSIICSDSRTYFNESQYGHGWLLLGDCAYAIDPLSGEGICKNFYMIDYMINNMKQIMAGKRESIKSYYLFNKSNFENNLKERITTYSAEQRWSSKPFWGRRYIGY